MQAPIQQVNIRKLPERNESLIDAAIAQAEAQLSVLPDCTWRPELGCSNVSQYECMRGTNKGTCAGDNWFDKPESGCTATCAHTMLLPFAPYYALWYPGPLAKDWRQGEEQPRYQHTAELLTLRSRGIDLTTSEVLMSDICKSSDNHFTGVSLFSPKYRDKAERLLRSCARVGVCCKVRSRALHCNSSELDTAQINSSILQQFDTATFDTATH